jgi:hypothetical protein
MLRLCARALSTRSVHTSGPGADRQQSYPIRSPAAAVVGTGSVSEFDRSHTHTSRYRYPLDLDPKART